MLEDIVTGLIKISLLPATALGIVAPVLIPFFMGDSWSPVSPIVQILLITFSVSFFTSPISTLPNVKGLQAGVFIYYNVLFLARAIALLAGWLAGGSELTVVWAYTLASVVVLLLFARYIVHSFGGRVKFIFQRVVPNMLGVCAVLTLAAVLLMFGKLYHPFGLMLVVIMVGILGWREIKNFVRSPQLGEA
jgi:O-antigen/teichoic acid export membrane protein